MVGTSRTNPAKGRPKKLPNKLPGSALSPAPWRVLKRGKIRHSGQIITTSHDLGPQKVA